MNRRKIAAGNWKMNTTIGEGLALLHDMNKGSRPNDVEMILCVPATHLKTMHENATNGISIGAQNMYFEDKGAYTGEISPIMLKEIGIHYVLVGHSERREYFNESNDVLARKLDKALEKDLKPIFCCGEPLAIRKANTHVAFVKNQLEESLFHLTSEQMKKVVLAYEPIWAIGTGETASPDQAQEMHAAIRNLLQEKYGNEIAISTPILYGGSVKPGNANDLFTQGDVDGGLVGGASLNAEGFTQIANSF